LVCVRTRRERGGVDFLIPIKQIPWGDRGEPAG
jgi:hypothetical protein